MALIKLTAFLDNISGKVNGSVFSRNKGGKYVRGKGNPTNPQTTAQMAVRAAFGAISSAWRALTEAQRNAWNQATEFYRYQNRLGDTQTLSGFALHQKLNRNLMLVEQTPISVPLMPQETASMTDATLEEVPESNSVIKATYSGSNPVDIIVLLYATPVLSPGISNFENKLRLIALGSPSEFTAGFDFYTAYQATFGTLVGKDFIGLKLVCVNRNTGQASAPAVISGKFYPAG